MTIFFPTLLTRGILDIDSLYVIPMYLNISYIIAKFRFSGKNSLVIERVTKIHTYS